MSQILELQELLKDTSAAIALTEQAVAATPESYGLLVNQRSLRKRFKELEDQFKKVSSNLSIDVCRYRMFREDDNPNALASTLAIADFQQLVSLVYDALSSGAKQRNRVSAEAVKETSFGIGYVFPGSVGFVLTLPAQRTLFEDGSSPLDHVIETIFGAALSRSENYIATVSKQLGPSVVRSIYKWVELHCDYWMGMDIEWMRGNAVKSRLFLQQKELAQLREVIQQTAEKIDDDITVEGTFVGGDVVKETVHVTVPGAADINAAFHESFNPEQIPKGYWKPVRAHFIKRTKIHLATDQEEVRYLVTKIEQIP